MMKMKVLLAVMVMTVNAEEIQKPTKDLQCGQNYIKPGEEFLLRSSTHLIDENKKCEYNINCSDGESTFFEIKTPMLNLLQECAQILETDSSTDQRACGTVHQSINHIPKSKISFTIGEDVPAGTIISIQCRVQEKVPAHRQ
ncbi:uncharacterized protein LOC121873202 [Homarus americanus]|uniref:uncharacterized protein LOC121873202 n=1 Tax=Homarus americanus TaxID=6706 RepID=UPI001C44D1C0|nr:uncharacterized protein LOC121873202 [Homarus americanus]